MNALGAKCFVAGGAGFIGSHLTGRLLAAGARVTVYDNLSFGRREHVKLYARHPGFRFIKADLLDSERLRRALAGHDTVYHLAANSDIMRAMDDPGLDFRQGIEATFRLLEAMRLSSPRRLVYLSGSGLYGDCGTTPVDEKRGPLNPQSMYGAAKLAAEGMISAYSHLYGIRAWIFRPANIIGARPTHGVISDFAAKLRRNPRRLDVLGDGRQSKSYLHVDDLLEAVFTALRRSKQNLQQFNVAGGDYITVRQIARIVVSEMHLKGVRIRYGRGARGWKGDIPRYRLDTKRLRALGWRAKLSAREAVRRTVREILGKNS